jgi:hypothetical protein
MSYPYKHSGAGIINRAPQSFPITWDPHRCGSYPFTPSAELQENHSCKGWCDLNPETRACNYVQGPTPDLELLQQIARNNQASAAGIKEKFSVELPQFMNVNNILILGGFLAILFFLKN